MATVSEKDLLESEVLAAVGREATRLPPAEITGFLAMRGNLYEGSKHKLMVVGRAVNGWTPAISIADLSSPEARANFAAKVLESSVVESTAESGGGCPMSWVTEQWGTTSGDYNTRRSAFWRVIRGVVKGLGIADVETATWPSHLVWSNLYKVSPKDQGNPSGRLREVQLPGCRELLRREFAVHQPSKVLFLAGADWVDPFRIALGGEWQEPPGFRHVCLAGVVRSDGRPTRCVVASHPQGKPESKWVEEVLTAFGE